ncbi:undecaprenyldiphospho-muramoylpentapeptide beta-N-acetylglucosaminyltransferase [Anaerobiospirillum sp. NML120448]|uniref:undecaprenyldiphospho-muramoylpentapeptide beta-N-acetylglucosaminyltransferase n=1 Tax=Anaerobiospirillum sp. NML120448 TaxID=2932816 RepID=UPI001FF16243|nr:undecaprenyldiphospho-muramoylpentapeptide beta-N-acetylglucosaminyltransferase [Anaerobiospirillum sp. NML120448]MCK0514289.1 undecaprenyldiphospho-muramoylpentapeptide beta-N-acetylglucosaminyltransferase [Anaerobiospirillum sp. NML120448]
MSKRVLVMAGGTGGHVFPALAIVKELQARGHSVEWLGTRGRIEERVVPNEGINIHYIDVKGVRRNGLMSLLKAPFMVMHAILQAKKVIKTFKPDVVIGFGGYASGPGGMAAYLSGIPLILHEQNAAAGMTNRILARFASKILLGVGQAFEGPKVESVGNPVRKEILELFNEERTFVHEDGKTHILIIGGSLGAQALNEHVPEALKLFESDDIVVFHQCGKDQSAKTAALYEGAKFEVQTSDFVEDMASAYRNADLIICRAGASTISEVSAAKLPAIFVPLPTAVDDHQTKNALSLVNIDAGKLLKQSELNANSLHDLIASMRDVATLKSMSEHSAQAAKLNATQRVCQIIEELANK